MVYDESHGISGLIFHQEEGVSDEKVMDGLLFLLVLGVDGKPFRRQGSGDGTGDMPREVKFVFS